MEKIEIESLIELFNASFADKFNTQLFDGGQEPIYIPAGQHLSQLDWQPGPSLQAKTNMTDFDVCDFHRIIFTYDYFASAMHEIAHWCIAGEARCLQIDFDYWYIPEGRNEHQQQAFYDVEIKPQAVEWILSAAAGQSFRVSTDSLQADGNLSPKIRQFAETVHKQVDLYCLSGIPSKAQIFREALNDYCGTPSELLISQFKLA